MRVLIVNTSETIGGAAIAASRLTDALNRHGVKAKMLVRDKQTGRVTTCAVPRSWRLRWAFVWERVRVWLANRLSKKNLFAVDLGVGGARITATDEFREADIIHLHWVNQGFLSLEEMGRILRSGKPVVWTLHDMWPVTGICHHAGECDHFQAHCHDCPQLQCPGQLDLSWQVFRHKAVLYSQSHIALVAVSQWMADRAKISALSQGQTVAVIPNTLPLEDFFQIDKLQARRELGLPIDMPVIAFGAARIDQPAKGLQRLLAAVQGMKVHLLLFGAVKDKKELSRLTCPFTYMGVVHGAAALSRLYSAADVVVNCSDYETFGQTLVEAMACGCTPVSFDRGGQVDIIHHLEDGYLARFDDVSDLAAGIRWALAAHLSAEELRHSVVTRFSEETVARQHIRLYEQLLNKRASS